MRTVKYLFGFFLLAFVALQANGQNIMTIHNGSEILYQNSMSSVDSLKFASSNAMIFQYQQVNGFEIPISDIDSITFTNSSANKIYIIYNGTDAATIINPYSDAGVTIEATNGHVTATSTSAITDLEYNILGTTNDGSLTLTSNQPVRLIMGGADITNPSGSAITIQGETSTVNTMYLVGELTTKLSNGSSSTTNGTLLTIPSLAIDGTGTLQVTSEKKHAIYSAAGTLTLKNGNISITSAASDAIHVADYTQEDGTVTLTATGDGIDVDNIININGGTVNITAATEDTKGMKGTTVNIGGGTVEIVASGDQSKGIKSSADVNITGGTVNITASGNVVLEALTVGVDPSYCSGIKTDGNFVMNDGELTVNCTSANNGGKGISSDGDITLNGGTVNITTNGNGATYTNESNEPDSYSSCGIKSDANIYLNQGNITCISTGTAGKGISADGVLTLGEANADNSLLILNVTTSGTNFLVSGWGNNADYANPKAVKSTGNLTVHSGTITIKSTGEGGEGLESKKNLTIAGGEIDITTIDDCINASTSITISGGTHSFVSSNNDAIDSNGTMNISGGLTIAHGAGVPECGIDCDQNTFAITGGIAVGTGGSTSLPTASASSQNSLRISVASGSAICIKNSGGTILLMMKLPTISSPGGGGRMVVLYTNPELTNGTYTIQYGGTISGGTATNGYYTTHGTYSGGSSNSFSVSGRLTNVNLR